MKNREGAIDIGSAPGGGGQPFLAGGFIVDVPVLGPQ